MTTAADTATEKPAASKPRRRRYVTVEAHVSEYVDVDIPLADIKTADLVAELNDRQTNGESIKGARDCGDAEFTLNVPELQAIRHLFLVGREVEAAERCRLLVQDCLGTAI